MEKTLLISVDASKVVSYSVVCVDKCSFHSFLFFIFMAVYMLIYFYFGGFHSNSMLSMGRSGGEVSKCC